jgi:hypothetical protein
MIIKIPITSSKMSITLPDGCAASAGTAPNMLRRYVRHQHLRKQQMDALNMHVHGRRYVSIHNMCVCTTVCTLCACIYHRYVCTRVIWAIICYALYIMHYIIAMCCALYTIQVNYMYEYRGNRFFVNHYLIDRLIACASLALRLAPRLQPRLSQLQCSLSYH